MEITSVPVDTGYCLDTYVVFPPLPPQQSSKLSQSRTQRMVPNGADIRPTCWAVVATTATQSERIRQTDLTGDFSRVRVRRRGCTAPRSGARAAPAQADEACLLAASAPPAMQRVLTLPVGNSLRVRENVSPAPADSPSSVCFVRRPGSR